MDPGWWTPTDAYCERCSPDFWAEPFNAASNAAFLVAAALVARRAIAAGAAGPRAAVLVGLLVVIGIGSFLFHTFANRWSLLADVIPIALFILVYFALAMRTFFGLGWGAAVAATLLYEAVAAGVGMLWGGWARGRGGDPLNGSFDYLPAALAMLVIGCLLIARPAAAASGYRLLTAAAVFGVSLAFRTIDQAVCATLPVGTHFLWHALNALLLYLLCDALFRHAASARATHPAPIQPAGGTRSEGRSGAHRGRH
ncbi:ceramidase domain-containing protein [Chelatococcus reniformis]|uniref:Membrane protein n=1 Tax=Chelatococcus reniformis TaxID=1494448 RepID=A0A916U353_9HYPH|nr:ceramidase domain-containing protein [Chelatococcus reniformis]GGC55312.1 membrane protein [Chelatococcus reniformis]